MKIVSWHEWLDKHIPYYEAERLKRIYQDNPPITIMILNPHDRIHVFRSCGVTYLNWDSAHELLVDSGIQSRPLFLERDTNGLWYWAFWSEKEALMTVLKFS